jgi:hypothetical protein
MSFHINYQILDKMGWTNERIPANEGIPHLSLYSYSPDLPIGEWNITKYYICRERQTIWAILEILTDSKLKDKKIYNFVCIDFSFGMPRSSKEEIKSNIELLKLVRKNLACNKVYQRYFQINSIIK